MTDLTSAKPRIYGLNFPTTDIKVVLGGTVYQGMALELSSGTAVAVSGAGTFAGFAMEDGVSGDVITARVQGCVLLTINTDTVAQADIGANTIEATDSDTFRIETGSSITGTTIGKCTQMHTSGAGGKHWCSFKATALLA